jgi:hypothetical protein
MASRCFFTILLIGLAACSANASDTADKTKTGDSPEIGSRTYAQNYRDMLLAWCIARAYEKEPIASRDAASTGSALDEVGNYDIENSTDAIDRLLKRYLNRDYHHPFAEYNGVQFGLLKCLDMYHSKELDAQVKQYVGKPNRTYQQDDPFKKLR